MGDAFTWTLPLVSKTLTDMFIGFLSFTNDAVIDKKTINDISLLDDSVINAFETSKKSPSFSRFIS